MHYKYQGQTRHSFSENKERRELVRMTMRKREMKKTKKKKKKKMDGQKGYACKEKREASAA